MKKFVNMNMKKQQMDKIPTIQMIDFKFKGILFLIFLRKWPM